MKRTKVEGGVAVYHAMSRVVGGEMLLGDREKEVLRKMLWKVADFCGVEILTYCVMTNHFHVLVRVPERTEISDEELLRRFKVLYPKPTKYQTAEFARLEQSLKSGDADAEAIRARLLARMSDLSEFMKTVKQRFSIWYNRNHGNRQGTLWMDRFKSVLVEGRGNPLQTMAAYIDLNPVRAGLVEDPKDYRFCGYAEAISGVTVAEVGLVAIWSDFSAKCIDSTLKAHCLLMFGKHASEAHLSEKKRAASLKVLEEEGGCLPKATLLRCRVRYFTDGAILGSEEFVRGFTSNWQLERERKHPPKVNMLRGSDWGGLAVIQGLRRKVFG